MSSLYEAKEFAFDWVNQNEQRLSDFDMEIWRYAEPAWREYRSAKAYVDLLRDEGFEVEVGSGEMPTAFMASWTQGSGGPVIGSYAEYDAVPGNSQQAVPYRAPREGLHPYAAGHTDPHSMLGVGALGGVLGAKAAMEKFNIAGTLKFFGEPAEKVCGSKPVHAAKGYFDDADAFISYHPLNANTTVWETHCGSYWSAVFTFECADPETWEVKGVSPTAQADPSAANPHSVIRTPGAIDALCLMYTLTKYTKEAMFPHTGTWTLNEFILAAGDATSDNLPPRWSQIQYSWRAPTLEIQEQIYRVLANNAKQAAGATGCQAHVQWVTKTRPGLSNNAMADLTFRNMELVGAPEYSEEAKEFGRELQRNLGLEPMENPFPDVFNTLTDPKQYEAETRRLLPEWQKNFTSDDYTDYTWHAPTVRVFTGRPVLRTPHHGYEYPNWAYNAMSGVPSIIDPGMMMASKTIAGTILDLLTVEGELEKATAEFNERTGGGVGGSKWVGPLLPREFTPPVDLRWPEYIQTERGEEWWIPTPTPGITERIA
ncbi:MAG: amidohydrolase [Thermomicrobiales bacterium]